MQHWNFVEPNSVNWKKGLKLQNRSLVLVVLEQAHRKNQGYRFWKRIFRLVRRKFAPFQDLFPSWSSNNINQGNRSNILYVVFLWTFRRYKFFFQIYELENSCWKTEKTCWSKLTKKIWPKNKMDLPLEKVNEIIYLWRPGYSWRCSINAFADFSIFNIVDNFFTCILNSFSATLYISHLH